MDKWGLPLCCSLCLASWPGNHWSAVDQKLCSAEQARVHTLLSDSKTIIPISKKELWHFRKSSKLHLHFATSPAEHANSSVSLQIAHEELVCWYIDLIWDFRGLTPTYHWINSQTNTWTYSFEEEYSISTAFAAETQREQTKIQLQKASRQYVYLWAPGQTRSSEAYSQDWEKCVALADQASLIRSCHK